VLADHLRVHGVRVDAELVAEYLAEARGVEHGAGAHHALGREPRAPRDDVGQHVDRVGDDDDQPAIAAQLPTELAQDLRVVAQEVEPRLVRLATAPRGEDERVGVEHLVEIDRAHGGRGIERRPVGEVHRLAFRDLAPEVGEPKLARETRVEDRDGDARADPSRANDANGDRHCFALRELRWRVRASGSAPRRVE
jgi:hypothetical protein